MWAARALILLGLLTPVTTQAQMLPPASTQQQDRADLDAMITLYAAVDLVRDYCPHLRVERADVVRVSEVLDKVFGKERSADLQGRASDSPVTVRNFVQAWIQNLGEGGACQVVRSLYGPEGSRLRNLIRDR